MSFYRLSKRISENVKEVIGLVYGDPDFIWCYYSTKGINITLTRINVVNKKGILIAGSKETEYSKSLWSWDDRYVVGETEKEAQNICKLFAASFEASFDVESSPLHKVDVILCVKDNVPTIV
jgi:hypothetical protein